ncbi:GumC family protein [Methylocapsa palsarum]|uniref:non-specific protein-tyrosine kinase n=1 Tax=Methylocapsa palsarum TaxID=1612308 RepID=A0A1I4C8X3_9HYPH|nr:polysaccharide biosynthesis tyrosine autokinase [Methylocapsa palsarum]SFK77080.1 capsular exopolysaccharide family [Methylocapsa palsarum]
MSGYAPARVGQRKGAQAAPEAAGLSLGQLAGVFARRWRVVCGVTLLVVLAGMAIFASLTPRYTGTATIMIDPKTPGSIGPGTDFGSAIAVDAAKIAGVASVIQSAGLLERLVKSEKLDEDPEFAYREPGLLQRFIALFQGQQVTSAPPKNLAGDHDDPIETAVQRLQSATSVTRDGASYIVKVEVKSRDPLKAARLAKAVSEAYINDQMQSKRDTSRRASDGLVSNLSELRKEVIRSEEAVAEIRRAYGLTATDGSGSSTIASQQITDLNAAIGGLETQLSLKQAKVEQARHVQQSGGNAESLPEVMGSSVISALRGEQASLLRKLAEMKPLPSQGGFAEARPVAVRAEQALRAIDASIAAEVSRIIANLENDYTSSRNNLDALKEQLKRLTGTRAGPAAGDTLNSEGQAKLREAQSVADANRQVYSSMLNKLKELQQGETIQEPEARIFEIAHAPKTPSFPRLPYFFLGSLLLGLPLGLATAFAAERLSSNRMRTSAFVTPKQVEQSLQLPMLAAVPRYKIDDAPEDKVKGKPAEADLVFIKGLVANRFSQFAEALRSIRLGLRKGDEESTENVIQITSSLPGEGKSTLAGALALSASLSGARVVLVDCDFRHATTSRLFNLTHEKGLSDLLAERNSWAEVAHRCPGTSLTVVPAGTCDDSSVDLIGSSKMIEMVNAASQYYDFVLLDSAPVLPVSDAVLISAVAKKTIILVEWNKTDRELVSQAAASVNLNKGHVIGVVLNKVDLEVVKSYGYEYSKHFAYGEKYYQDAY